MPKALPSLSDAAFAGDDKLVAKILAKTPPPTPDEIDWRDSMGFAPLHWAADHGHDKVVALLLAAGADPDAQDMDGLTPLHYASIKGHLDCARLLIPVADIDLRDHKRDTTARDRALDSVRMAFAGFDVGRGEPAGKIAELLADEPARRAAAAQAAILHESTGPATARSPKPRI